MRATFQAIAVALACISATTANPIQPLSERNAVSANWYDYRSEPAVLSNGTMIYSRGPVVETVLANAHDKREDCPVQGKIKCSQNHVARNSNCQHLIDELEDAGDTLVSDEPRQICYWGDMYEDSGCCVSWSSKLPEFKKGDIAPLVDAITKRCSVDGVSGLMESAQVGGEHSCTSVCVSDRGHDCE